MESEQQKVKRSHLEEDSQNHTSGNRIPSVSTNAERKVVSYKDLLLGHIPSAYQQAFFNNESKQMDILSDNGEDDEPLSNYEVQVVL